MKHRFTIKALIMSTGLIRLIFAFNTIFVCLLGLFVERSLEYDTFHSTHTKEFVANDTLLYVILFSSTILIIDACLAIYHVFHKSNLIKKLCNAFVGIRYLFWIPSILTFVVIAYYVAIDFIKPQWPHNKYDTIIVIGYYLSYAMFGLIFSLNEAFIANRMVKSEKENEK